MRFLPFLLVLSLGTIPAAGAQSPRPAQAPKAKPKPTRLVEPPMATSPMAAAWPEPAPAVAALPGDVWSTPTVTITAPVAAVWPTPAVAVTAPLAAAWSVPAVTIAAEPGEVLVATAAAQVEAIRPIGSTVGLGSKLRLPEPSWSGPRDTPEDSLYRVARETLNRGEYRRAAEQFATFTQRYPQSRYRPAAIYWQSFALYRAGTEADLRRSLGLLDELAKQSGTASDDPDVSALMTRVIGALASRGDEAAAARLRDGAARNGASCDREDIEVKAEALSALVQNDPAGSRPVLTRILARRDECSVPLRRRAVYLLGKDGDASRVDEVLEIAKTDPSREVRSDAISRLAQIPGDRSTAALEQFLNASNDEGTQRAVIRALRSRDDANAARTIRRLIEREDVGDELRAEAIRSLVGCCGAEAVWVASPSPSGQNRVNVAQARRQPGLSEADVALLRGVYEKSASRTVRTAVVETIARAGGAPAEAWLMALVRNPAEDLRFRSAALGRLRRAETPIDELGRLYDALTERELRSNLVQILADREEPGATDKLIEIVKTGTDPVIRRMAISALTRKKDPRSTKLLLDLVEK